MPWPRNVLCRVNGVHHPAIVWSRRICQRFVPNLQAFKDVLWRGWGKGEQLTATTSICNQAQHAMLHLKEVLCCSHFLLFSVLCRLAYLIFPRKNCEKTQKQICFWVEGFKWGVFLCFHSKKKIRLHISRKTAYLVFYKTATFTSSPVFYTVLHL